MEKLNRVSESYGDRDKREKEEYNKLFIEDAKRFYRGQCAFTANIKREHFKYFLFDLVVAFIYGFVWGCL